MLVMRALVGRAVSAALFVGSMGALLSVAFALPLPLRPADAGSLWASINLAPASTVVGIMREFHG